MKRLILASTLAFASASLLAAGFEWSSLSTSGGNLYDGSSTKLYATDPSATLYLFMADTISYQSMYEALKGGADASTKSYVASTGLTDASKVNPVTFSQDAVKGTHDFYFVTQFDKDSKSYIYLSSILNGTYADVDTAPLQWSDLNSNSKTTFDASKVSTAQAGVFQAVPEPFSGSLALLGVGLVALRRKMKKQKKA